MDSSHIFHKTIALRLPLAALAAMFLLIAGGCASSRTQDNHWDDSPPIAYSKVNTTAKELLEQAAFSTFKTLDADIKATVYSSQDRIGSFKGILLISPPDSLRIVLLDAFGSTAMDILRKNGMMEVYIPRQNIIYVGKTPSLSLPEDASFEVIKEEREIYLHVLDGETPALNYEFRYNGQQLYNSALGSYDDKGLFMNIDFADFGEEDIPHTIIISFYNGFAVEITVDEHVLNEPLEAKAFSPMNKSNKIVRSIADLLEMEMN